MTRFVDKVCGDASVSDSHLKSLHQMVPGVVAFLHPSHAVKLDPGNLKLLGGRCRCSLDNLQFHFALQDAEEMVHVSIDEIF